MSGLGGVNFEDLRIAGIDNELNEASKTFKPKEKNNMDDEQLQKIGGAVAGVAGAAGIVAGLAGRGKIKDEIAAANANVDALMNQQPSLSTPSEYYDAVKNAYDQQLLSMRNQDINRALATTTQAASQYGSRGLGAIMGAQQQAQQQLRQEAMTQQQLQTQAMNQLAQARQMETQLKEARSARDIEYGYDKVARAQAELARKDQMLVSGIQGVLNAGASIIAAEKGAKVQKTPGEFSHERNEMYVVDEDGKSMGISLTGGEYVIAPDDARRLKEQSAKGKTPLHKFVRRLVNRFEKADDNG